MSVSEREHAKHIHLERRMSNKTSFEAAREHEVRCRDIMSVSEREHAKHIHRERRMIRKRN